MFKIVHMTVEEFLNLEDYSQFASMTDDHWKSGNWFSSINKQEFVEIFLNPTNPALGLFRPISKIKNPLVYILEYAKVVLDDIEDYKINNDNEIVKNYEIEECQRSVLNSFREENHEI